MPNGFQFKVVLKKQPDASATLVALMHELPDEAASEAGKKSSFVAVSAEGTLADEIEPLARFGMLTGKSGAATIHIRANGSASKFIILGLGKAEKVSAESYRAAGGALATLVRDQKLTEVTVQSASDPAELVTGFVLRSFTYTDYKGSGSTKDKKELSVTLTLAGDFSAEQKAAIDRAVLIAQAQNYARGIASRPGNDINPPSLAAEAVRLGKEVGLSVTILDEKKMKQLGMGGILGVGAGSNVTPPRMIVLEYRGKNIDDGKSKTAITAGKTASSQSSTRSTQSSILNVSSSTLLVVGKAITFDTGGISIKGAAGMQKMIFDKCGGMAVLGLMHAVARLKLNCHVVGILASAENHISETAYRPGDILKMYNGVTVEVTNTDAEGRLVLGDALAWGIETYKPAAVVDLATLTGGVVVALGKTMAGIMSNNDAIVDELQAAANLTGEKMWRLPIGEDQRDLLKSDPADIVNSGAREASPLQGGAFLSYFVPDATPWAHIDIAGVADTEKDLPYYAKGATGWGVRTLVEWVTQRISK